MRKTKNLNSKINMEYYDLLATTTPDKYMPKLECNIDIYPDYITSFNRPGKFNYTSHTAVAFYEWDSLFNGQKGLLNSIIYNDKKRLDYFKKKYHGVKYFISPDYSLINNFEYPLVNMLRIFEARLVSLWFTMELNTIVIPNMTYTNDDSFELMVDGLKDCHVVCLSAVSCITDIDARLLLEKAVKYAVDNLELHAIIVYTTTYDDSIILDIFKYAVNNNVKIIVPDNSLRISNRGKKNGKN